MIQKYIEYKLLYMHEMGYKYVYIYIYGISANVMYMYMYIVHAVLQYMYFISMSLCFWVGGSGIVEQRCRAQCATQRN